VSLEDGQVTFRFTPRPAPSRTMTLDAMRFLQRFLQPVLPTGFQNIRSSGFLHPSVRATLSALQTQLAPADPSSDRLPEALAATFGRAVPAGPPDAAPRPETPRGGPHWGGPVVHGGRLPPSGAPRAPP